MRISELAAATAVPVATLKYYLREGLLHPGRRTAPNQALYGESHVSRVRLLRILREVGDLPVARIQQVVKAIEHAQGSRHEALASASDALARVPPPAGPYRRVAESIAAELIEKAGWSSVRPHAPDRDNLAATLEVIIASGTHDDRFAILESYARAADQIARFEIADLDADADVDALVAQAVVGQVVFGGLLAILRRLAEEHHSAVRFGTVPDG
jgi:DNA-binding transcriptional MerR regulator